MPSHDPARIVFRVLRTPEGQDYVTIEHMTYQLGHDHVLWEPDVLRSDDFVALRREGFIEVVSGPSDEDSDPA